MPCGRCVDRAAKSRFDSRGGELPPIAKEAARAALSEGNVLLRPSTDRPVPTARAGSMPHAAFAGAHQVSRPVTAAREVSQVSVREWPAWILGLWLPRNVAGLRRGRGAMAGSLIARRSGSTQDLRQDRDRWRSAPSQRTMRWNSSAPISRQR